MASFRELISSPTPVLIDFFATWCGPCKALAPVLQEIKSDLGDAISILKIDVDKNKELAASYQIQGVPTLILYQDGVQLWRGSGVFPKHELLQIIKDLPKL